MSELIPWRADPVALPAHPGTVAADRLRVRADYPITGVAIVLLVLQAVFLLPLLAQLDITPVAVPVLLAVDAVAFGAMWALRERARRDVGRLESSYVTSDVDRDGVTRNPSLAGLLAVSRERHEAIRAVFLESYATLEDLVAAHPDGLPADLVAGYGQDVRACRRLWDAARAR